LPGIIISAGVHAAVREYSMYGFALAIEWSGAEEVVRRLIMAGALRIGNFGS
jgi:hypothetical protein